MLAGVSHFGHNTSENAIRIQITGALIAFVLLWLAKASQNTI
ncbi:hypothetical protein SAE02_41690 [Skermanella aerolata]|uniref:Uncharacterized protein n=1 Tax=Skermanella aerolata TaxID=393310 RepID=A0A512DU73_9PROT|nr:hypothetical protein SAE02_41690 [Skermanella aerolata]